MSNSEPPPSRPAADEAPVAPAIPSFASLRAPRGRSAVDLLVPGTSSAPPPRPAAATPAPRPAEYADLLRFGGRAVRAAAAMPWRVVGWAVREPMLCVRRLLGA